VLVLVRTGNEYTPQARVVTLSRGQRSFTVPVLVHGNTRDDLDTVLTPVLLKPLSGVITGDYVGGVQVQDDDPTPALTAAPVDTAVTEGGTLRWRFTLSEPSNIDVYVPLGAVAPAGGAAELSTDDVPASWVEERLGEVPTQPLPFSEAGLVEYVLIPAGATSADLAVPTTTDARAEGTETLTWEVAESEEQPQLPAGTRFAGTVADAA
jgi:hypothetical protein